MIASRRRLLVGGAGALAVLVLTVWLVAGAGRGPGPAQVPQGPPSLPATVGAAPATAVAEPVAPGAPGVPAAAWRRELGAVLADPGVNKEGGPGNGDDGPVQGAPIGGLGAGTIGRTYRGDFARWHLAPGEDRYGTVWADQFSVRVARAGATPAARVLLPSRPPHDLAAWNWDYPAAGGTYAALYPFAWYHYDAAAAGVDLLCRQFSPVIPQNYRESSYPVAVFEWTATNAARTPADVSLLFTWQNPLGWDDPRAGSAGNTAAVHRDTLGGAPMLGVVFGRDAPGGGPGPARVSAPWDGQFAIAAQETPGVSLSVLGGFDPHGDGAGVWAPWQRTGYLSGSGDSRPTAAGQDTAGALSASFHLAPGERRQITFVLTWDLPIMQFGPATHPEQWYRRYTEWFGTDGHHAWDLARAALPAAPAWAAALAAWQAPILADPSHPAWYPTALFNELYDLVDGGTIWENGRVGDPAPSRHRFAYLECFDYPFYATLDVRFYGSFAELMLWPELELGEMREFADAIPQADLTPYLTQDRAHQRPAVRKVAGAAPHDLGRPGESPWTRINAYQYQDVNDWKDLNSKFVLLVYRDYVATGDRAFLTYCWPAVQAALAYLKTLDHDGDGIPENTNFPDQTYDTWVMQGVSAYCGSLWLAALEAGAAMGDLEGAPAVAAQYRAWFAQAQPRFEAALWNGRYYNFDTGSHPWHDSVMADQLAGQWYAAATGLPPIVPADHTRSVLATVYRLNVQDFGGGQMGAVNGMRPTGVVDTSDPQAQEVWTGVSYALAGFMLQEGLDAPAWATAYGVYHVTYETKGYWFRTPEAWDSFGNFRAAMYMRPQAIWALQWALARRAHS